MKLLEKWTLCLLALSMAALFLPSDALAAGTARISLNWDDNTEPDFAYYNVYRSTSAEGSYTQVNALDVIVSEYIDENLENEEDRQPTGEELGIRPGQLWVRRTATGNRVTRSTTGYPHLVQVNTTDAAWRGLVSVNIILPAVLNHKSFNIKPFFLLEAYELYLNETSYL